MKACKSCFKEIEDAAIKCPYCQSNQVWYKNSAILGLVFPLIFIPLMFYSMGIWFTKSYAGNENSFKVEEINHAQDNLGQLLINYKISNETNTKWHSIVYEVSFYDASGKLLLIQNGQEYSWVLPPEQSAALTVKANTLIKPEKWVFRIVDLDSGRF